MGDSFKEGNRHPCRIGRSSFIAAIAVLGLAVALAAGPAVAKKITGTKRGELIVGTKKADRINGKGGNDLIKGKGGNDLIKGKGGNDLIKGNGGNDRLNGGKGSNRVIGGKGKDTVIGGPLGDTLIGGPGVDSHFGGAGNDLLNTADGRRDRVIDGGPGANKCVVDVLELSIVRNCGSVQGGTPGGGQGPGGGGGGGGGGGSGPAPGQGLQVLTVDVMCGPPNPLTGVGCSFHITGDGADAPGPGSVESGGGGVTNVLGGAGSLSPPNWDALGVYSCTAAGFLRVIIGAESVDVPVPCG
jgi:Ca2+-binding RTX toxin-like protein